MKIIWRTHTTVILIAGIVILVAASALSYMLLKFEPRTPVWFGSTVFELRLADTDAERVKGLSGVPVLGPNDGLLMAYPHEDYYGIWMKGMMVPLDIVWLDENKKVIYTVINAAPELGDSQTFTPKEPAQYVVELPAGSVKKFNIRTGDVAKFDDVVGVE